MTSPATRLPTAEGHGSVTGVPNLPEGFADTFTSRFVDIGELRLHAVIGGEGQAPEALLAALTGFLAPYREQATAATHAGAAH